MKKGREEKGVRYTFQAQTGWRALRHARALESWKAVGGTRRLSRSTNQLLGPVSAM